MARNNAIKDVDYYEKQAQEERRNVDYYAKDGEGVGGKWWTYTSPALSSSSLIPFVKHGAPVDAGELYKLVDGYHPQTGEDLIKRNTKKRNAGYDQENSPLGKDGSSLWGLAKAEYAASGDPFALDMAQKIEALHHKANDRMMKYIADNGLMITRIADPDKPGKTMKVSVAHMAGAQYFHHLSREGDPHLHTHNVIANTCVRPDGSTGTLDNREIKRHMGAIAAIGRCVANEGWKELGFAVERDGRNSRIIGFPDEVYDVFSKSRKRIKEELKKQGIDNTADHREAAVHANRNSRKHKSELPPEKDLINRWGVEAKSLGWDFHSIFASCTLAADKKRREDLEAYAQDRREAAAKGITLPEEMPEFDFDKAKANAVAKLSDHHSVFEDRTLRKEFFEELQIHCNADEAIALLDQVKQDNTFVKCGYKGRDDVFTTEALNQIEKKLTRDLRSMRHNGPGIDAEIIERHIAAGIKGPNGEVWPLRPEQAEAVRTLCGPGQYKSLKGLAGTGKTTVLGVVVAIHQEAGFTVHGMAPSWKATGQLREDTKLSQEYARAIQGWLHRVESKQIVLSDKDLVLWDEAGMVGTRDFAGIVGNMKLSGAKGIGAGDDRQLQPVTAGAPFRIALKEAKTASLEDISRQKILWQQASSKLMATGEVKEGLAPYSERGHIRLHEDRDSAMEALVTDYMADIATNPHQSRMIIASRNHEARTINELVRERRIELGELKGESATIKAYTRGQNPRVKDLELMSGDRIMLGETIKIDGEQYDNNSTGTLLKIEKREGKEAAITIQWDDGRITSSAESAYVGFRDRKSKDKPIPKLSHAYAMTVHASQGQTVDRCFILNAEGMGAEATYVAFTRHRWNVTMYSDESRIDNIISTKDGVTMRVTKGDAKTTEQDATGDVIATPEMVREYLIRECSKSELKENIRDFQKDVERWLDANEISDFADLQEEIDLDELVRMPDDNSVSTNAVADVEHDAFAIAAVKLRGVGAIGRYSDPHSETQVKADKAREERIASDIPASVPKPKRPLPANAGKSRISEEEIAVMANTSLFDYVSGDATLVTKATGERSTKGLREWTFKHSNDVKTVVTEFGSGWGFFNRDGSAKGSIIDYVAWRDGTTRGAAMHTLRKDLRTQDAAKDTSFSYTQREKAPEIPLAERFNTILAKPYVAETFEKTRRAFMFCKAGISDYLLRRGINRETQTRFASEIRNEPDHWNNKGGVAIRMSDIDGNFVGYIRKGPKKEETGKSFSGLGSGSEPRLAIHGDHKTPQRVYVGETIIDSWSLYQKDGSPKNVLVSATPGSVSDNALADLYALAKRHPEAEFVFVGQNDKQSTVFENKVRAAITEGNPEAKFVVRRPPEEFKDWNDELRGIRSTAEAEPPARAIVEEDRKAPAVGSQLSDGKKAVTEKMTEQAKQRAEERAAAEAERRRLKDEYEARPTGPRR